MTSVITDLLKAPTSRGGSTWDIYFTLWVMNCFKIDFFASRASIVSSYRLDSLEVLEALPGSRPRVTRHCSGSDESVPNERLHFNVLFVFRSTSLSRSSLGCGDGTDKYTEIPAEARRGVTIPFEQVWRSKQKSPDISSLLLQGWLSSSSDDCVWLSLDCPRHLTLLCNFGFKGYSRARAKSTLVPFFRSIQIIIVPFLSGWKRWNTSITTINMATNIGAHPRLEPRDSVVQSRC